MAGEMMRRGDLVEVRSPAEILETLDQTGALEMLPFMPEMAAYCGLRFKVDGRVERVCDTVNVCGIRQLKDSVYLQDLRCSGESHGSCQAECRYFWKEAWLRPVTAGTSPARSFTESERQALVARTALGVQRQVSGEGEIDETRWRCQATDLPDATTRVNGWNALGYARELTNGNVPIRRFTKVMGRAVVRQPMNKLGLISAVHLKGTREKPLGGTPLDLRPGELVQIKSKEEIAETLTKEGRNKGLWFDREMMAYCGQIFRVRRRITRFINDRDGKMIELKSDCVTLDGCVCSGDHSLSRWFCARAIYPYWREIWLRRVVAVDPHNIRI
jgi:hypothetical protein